MLTDKDEIENWLLVNNDKKCKMWNEKTIKTSVRRRPKST